MAASEQISGDEASTGVRADRRPAMPAGASDCHVHVFGPPGTYPGGPGRSYSPVERTLEEYEALAAKLGLERVVFVQPSGYGLDNRCQLDALSRRKDTARAVIVADDSLDAAELGRLDRLGVRGVRLNLMTPRITDVDAARDLFSAAAARIGRLGWHIQVYADLAVVEALSGVIRGLDVPVVFDHMAGASAEEGVSTSGFSALLDLLTAGKCWVKLSGADIMTWRNSGFEEAEPFARRLIAAGASHLVWGSDWPHLEHVSGPTGDAAPPARFRPVDEDSLLEFLWRCSGDEATFRRILVDNPARLYGF